MKNKFMNFAGFLGKALVIVALICIYVIMPIAILCATWYVLVPVFWWEKFLTLLLSFILPVIYEVVALVILTLFHD